MHLKVFIRVFFYFHCNNLMNITTTVGNCKIRSDLKPDDEAMMKAHLIAFTGGSGTND